MARIIPAKLKTNSNELVLAEALERWLDDDYVVFQPKPARPYFLVVHPTSDIIILVPRSDAPAFNPDAESLTDDQGKEIEPSEILKRSALDAAEKGIPLNRGVSGWVVFPSIAKASVGVDDELEGVAFKDEVLNGSLIEKIKALRRFNEPEERWLNLTEIINLLQPRAEPYQRGEITDYQKQWRQIYTYIHATAEPVDQAQAVPPAVEPPASTIPVATAPAPQETADENPEKVAKRLQVLCEMIRVCAESVIQEEDIFVSGMALSAKEFTHPQMVLPALLVAASDSWSLVVKKQKFKGGFHVRLKSNDRALLGLEVIDIDPAAPFTLFMPVTNAIRAMRTNNGFNADRMMESFLRWLKKNDLDPELAEDIDIRLLMVTSQ